MTKDEIENVAHTLEHEFSRRFKYRNVWRRWLLYTEAEKLSGLGFGVASISRALTSQSCSTIRSSTITNWFRRYHPLGRNVIPIVNPCLGYLLGAGLGDGSGNFTESELRFQGLRDIDFARKLKASTRCCSWIYRRPGTEIFDVEISNRILTELVATAKLKPMVLQTLLAFNAETTRAAISGFFDAEGWGGGNLGAAVTKREMIDLICILLAKEQIHYTRTSGRQDRVMISPSNHKEYVRNSEFIHKVTIRRCCFRRFARIVGFSIRRKQENLELFISSNRFVRTCA